jgi:phage shock protein A
MSDEATTGAEIPVESEAAATPGVAAAAPAEAALDAPVVLGDEAGTKTVPQEGVTEEQLAETSANVRVELLAKSVLALKQTYEAQTAAFAQGITASFENVGQKISAIEAEIEAIKQSLTTVVLERANASGATPIQRVEALEKTVQSLDGNFKPGC